MSLQKIFFSYSRIDGSAFALKLAPDLKKEGFDVWIDQEDIRAGSEWDLEIEKALETCDCLLFIETEKSVVSNNVLDEVYYALEEKKKVIPLILIDSKTPFRLKRLQHIDFTKNYDTGLTLLLNELKGNNVAATFPPDDIRSMVKDDKPFYKKYSGLVLIIASLIIIVAAIFIFTAKNNKLTDDENLKTVNKNDTALNDQALLNTLPEATAENDTVMVAAMDEKKVKPQQFDKKIKPTNNKPINYTGTETVNKPGDNLVNLNETFAGEWQLISVEPKAQSTKGYLKIDVLDDAKVTIKSYMQFYYSKSNDTSFLTIFNAFAGCTSCILKKEMKITAEDIAIGSQVYKTLKQHQADGGKIGDTIMQAGANKSIRASVTLQLVNNRTAIIKVQQANVTALSHGMVLQPFVYSFSFTKSD